MTDTEKSQARENTGTVGDAPSDGKQYARKDGEWAEVQEDGNTQPLEVVTYSQLVEKRDNSQLVPGMQYRIMDYQCTTTQLDTMSAGHQFDIIVTADDVNVLNENARAIRHAGDTYFADAHLESWELKYSLDNDTSRFAWADSRNIPTWISSEEILDGEHLEYQGLFLTHFENYPIPVYGTQEQAERYYDHEDHPFGFIDTGGDGFIIEVTDSIALIDIYFNNIDGVGTTSSISTDTTPIGKGVIYYMKDEWNNECPYDFKNIMFKRNYADDIDDELQDIISDDWECSRYVTFITDNNPHIGNYDDNDYIWAYTFTTNSYDDVDAIIDASLNSKNKPEFIDNDQYYWQYCNGNVISQCMHIVSIDENELRSLQVLNNIVFMDTTESPDMSGSFEPTKIYANKLGENSYDMTFAGHAFCNEFGDDASTNLFFKVYSNTFGNNCYYNTFGNNCYSNTFGNNCYSNTFGNYCQSNTFGNYCQSNTFGNYCCYNTFGNDCYSNTFGNYCQSNTLLDNATHTETDAYARWNIFENGVSYVDLRADEAGDPNNYLQNITIRQGIVGSYSSHKVITEARNLTHDVTYRAQNSEDKTI